MVALAWPRTSELVEGRYRQQRPIQCRVCEKIQTVSDGTRTGMPPDLLAKKFAFLGWRDMKNGKGLCPDCCHGKQPAKAVAPPEDTPETRLAKWRATVDETRKKNVRKPRKGALSELQTLLDTVAAEEPKMAEIHDLHPQPIPPPAPTRQDRRKILDALDEHYDVPHQCYRKTLSDKRLGEMLDLPAAWIAEERERAFGPNRNNSEVEKIARLEVRSNEIYERLMAMAQEADDLKKELGQIRAERETLH